MAVSNLKIGLSDWPVEGEVWPDPAFVDFCGRRRVLQIRSPDEIHGKINSKYKFQDHVKISNTGRRKTGRSTKKTLTDKNQRPRFKRQDTTCKPSPAPAADRLVPSSPKSRLRKHPGIFPWFRPACPYQKLFPRQSRLPLSPSGLFRL